MPAMGGREHSTQWDWAPLFAGAAAGSSLTIVGHPFDTTKVRMQADVSRYRSASDCVRKIIAEEGVLALYRGLPPALLTACITSGLRFGVQHRFNSWLAARLSDSGGGSSGGGGSSSGGASFEQLSLTKRVLAEGGGGAACGLVLPLIFTPMELVKVRRQASSCAATNWQIARDVFREHGIRGLYTGHRLTVARSTLGNAALFGSYEAFRGALSRFFGWDAAAAPAHLLAGVLSGWCSMIVTFPLDAAKSRQQLAVDSGGGGPLGIRAGLLQLWRENALYRGLSPMLLRALPVHIVYLPSFAFFMSCVGKSDG